jgi:hypothetical protein
MSQSEKYVYTSKLGSWLELFVEFFMMNDIDIHQSNLGPFKIIIFLVQNSFKECVYLHLYNNKCIIIFF